MRSARVTGRAEDCVRPAIATLQRRKEAAVAKAYSGPIVRRARITGAAAIACARCMSANIECRSRISLAGAWIIDLPGRSGLRSAAIPGRIYGGLWVPIVSRPGSTRWRVDFEQLEPDESPPEAEGADLVDDPQPKAREAGGHFVDRSGWL